MTPSPTAQRGRVFLEQGRFAEAEKFFRQSLAEEPNDAQTLYFLAVCLLNQNQGAEALTAVDRAISLEPEVADLHAFKAIVLSSQRKPGPASASADEAIRLDPNSDYAWSARASVFLSRNEWAMAEVAARHALELNPDNGTAANQLAHALRLQNRLAESAEQTSYMLGQNPEDAQTRVTAGWTDLQRGDRRLAETHFLEALRLDANNEDAREGLKEAFRARSPLYRGYLAYCFFLQRFTQGKQWLIIIGFLLAMKVARAVLPGPLALVVVVLYFLFVLWSHVARAVGNLQLCLDRFARHALKKAEKREAWIVGGGVLAGLFLLFGGLLAANKPIGVLGVTLIGTAFPLAYTFTNQVVLGRTIFGLAGLFVFAAGSANTAAYAGWVANDQIIAVAAGAAVVVVIAVLWLANVPALVRR